MKEIEIFINNGKRENILPIYYKINKEDVNKALPKLANNAFEIIDCEFLEENYLDHLLCRISCNFFAKITLLAISWNELLAIISVCGKPYARILHTLMLQFQLSISDLLLSIVNLYNIVGICNLSYLETKATNNRKMQIGFNHIQAITKKIFIGNYKPTIYDLELAEVVAKYSVNSIVNVF
jgi:hypothetical protein